jgi:ABC-type dipeptide/oligopeptide/nickel transport system permease component
MSRYIIRRPLILPVVMFGLSVPIFAMLQLLDPIERAASYVTRPPQNPGALTAIIRKYVRDQPVYV